MKIARDSFRKPVFITLQHFLFKFQLFSQMTLEYHARADNCAKSSDCVCILKPELGERDSQMKGKNPSASSRSKKQNLISYICHVSSVATLYALVSRCQLK